MFQKCLLNQRPDDCPGCVVCKIFMLECSETELHKSLDEIIRKISNDVQVQNYPSTKNNKPLQNVHLKTSNFRTLATCISQFRDNIPNSIRYTEMLDTSFWRHFELMKEEKFLAPTLEIIINCYAEYGPEHIFLNFNGGKDCTVLLYLTLYVLERYYPNYKEPLLCVYIQTDNPFVEVETFIYHCKTVYNLEVFIKEAAFGIKPALEELLQQKPYLTACLMGTRRTDPYARNLKYLQMSDADWPQVMRVNPVLDWNYEQIWRVLVNCKFPYCPLYDEGYTSIGNKFNTIPNPDLKYIHPETKKDCYYPAFQLKDETKERNGRIVDNNKQKYGRSVDKSENK